MASQALNFWIDKRNFRDRNGFGTVRCLGLNLQNAFRSRYLGITMIISALLPATSAAADEITFNKYILKSVDYIAHNRANGGYSNQAFYQNLQYGRDCCVRASHKVPPHGTMCVAGVSEVIIEGLNIYSKETGDESPFAKLPMSSWNHGNITSIRASMFLYKDSGSQGTAFTLQRFGIGLQKPFSELIPGDFINFNRVNGHGHAVVFLGYLDSSSRLTTKYSPDIIGFKDFTAQGMGKPDAGFTYRYAYFDGHCPRVAPGPRDCEIIRSNNASLFNTGGMLAPSEWKAATAAAALTRSISGQIARKYRDRARGFVDSQIEIELNRDLQPDPSKYIGDTTD